MLINCLCYWASGEQYALSSYVFGESKVIGVFFSLVETVEWGGEWMGLGGELALLTSGLSKGPPYQ